MKILDIAWLGGLLEGEGCFGLRKSGGYKGEVYIALQMTDRDVVARVADLWERPLLGPHGPYGVSKKATFQTMTVGSRAAGWMMTLHPLMGARRKAKIEELLAHWKTQQTIHPGRKLECHPERQYFAKGLCNSCYSREYQKKQREAVRASCS